MASIVTSAHVHALATAEFGDLPVLVVDTDGEIEIFPQSTATERGARILTDAAALNEYTDGEDLDDTLAAQFARELNDQHGLTEENEEVLERVREAARTGQATTVRATSKANPGGDYEVRLDVADDGGRDYLVVVYSDHQEFEAQVFGGDQEEQAASAYEEEVRSLTEACTPDYGLVEPVWDESDVPGLPDGAVKDGGYAPVYEHADGYVAAVAIASDVVPNGYCDVSVIERQVLGYDVEETPLYGLGDQVVGHWETTIPVDADDAATRAIAAATELLEAAGWEVGEWENSADAVYAPISRV